MVTAAFRTANCSHDWDAKVCVWDANSFLAKHGSACPCVGKVRTGRGNRTLTVIRRAIVLAFFHVMVRAATGIWSNIWKTETRWSQAYLHDICVRLPSYSIDDFVPLFVSPLRYKEYPRSVSCSYLCHVSPNVSGMNLAKKISCCFDCSVNPAAYQCVFCFILFW